MITIAYRQTLHENFNKKRVKLLAIPNGHLFQYTFK